MDVQQLTPTPGRTAWSLRDGLAEGSDQPDLPAWWLLEPVILGGSAEAGPQDVVDAARPHRAPLGPSVALVVVALALCAAAGVALLAGVRWFVVETPSMGTAAPVGSLVVTTPTTAGLHRGDVIAFLPPGSPRTYTHRVFSVAADGSIRTKGDINASPDPWTLDRSAVLGRAVAVLPGAGFLLRGTPAFIAGALLLWTLTRLIRRRALRAAVRVTGLHLVTTAVILWLHPFVQVVLIATENAAQGVRASIVSTGLLPVRLVDSAGTVIAHLSSGEPQVVAMPAGSAGGRIAAMPDLGWALQLGLIGLAVLPALVVLLVGLPHDPEPEPAS